MYYSFKSLFMDSDDDANVCGCHGDDVGDHSGSKD